MKSRGLSKAPLPKAQLVQSQAKPFLILGGLIGLFNPDVRKATADFKKQLKNVEVVQSNMTKFADVYAARGWVLYDQISTDLVALAVTCSMPDGEQALRDEFLHPDSLHRLGYRFLIPRYEHWAALFDRSVERSVARDYLSAVPLIFIIIDGVCLDQAGQHPFSGATEEPVFDAVVSERGGVAAGLKLMGTTRRKRNSEAIDIPYRHGIMHGIDTNFGNDLVAAKAYNLLWAVINYFDSKVNEPQRISAALREQAPITFSELGQSLLKNSETKSKLQAWSARQPVSDAALYSCANEVLVEEIQTPEQGVGQYLEFLKAGNYGRLAERTMDFTKRPNGKWAGDLRAILRDFKIIDWVVTGFEDCAPAISEVSVTLTVLTDGAPATISTRIRLLYCDRQGEAQVRGEAGGTWQAMSSFLYSLPHSR